MLLNFSGKFSRVKPISSQISDQKEVRWLILVWPELQDQKFTEKTGDSTIFQADFGQKICEFIHWKQAVQCSIGSVVQCSAVFADVYTFSDPGPYFVVFELFAISVMFEILVIFDLNMFRISIVRCLKRCTILCCILMLFCMMCFLNLCKFCT